MSIEIDQRSEVSAYIKVGDITIYVEHSEAAPEFIDIWRNPKETLFTNNAWVSFMGFRNNSRLRCRRLTLFVLVDE